MQVVCKRIHVSSAVACVCAVGMCANGAAVASQCACVRAHERVRMNIARGGMEPVVNIARKCAERAALSGVEM